MICVHFFGYNDRINRPQYLVDYIMNMNDFVQTLIDMLHPLGSFIFLKKAHNTIQSDMRCDKGLYDAIAAD